MYYGIMKSTYLFLKTRIGIKQKALLNWLLPKQASFEKFVIICSARTGSTLLHTYLNSHPNILSYGEILRERNTKDIATNLREDIFKSHGKNVRAVGLKCFLSYRDDARFSDQYFEILADASIKIIVLRREDAKEQLMSLQLAKATGEWSFARQANRPSLEVGEGDLEEFTSKLDQQYTKIRADLQHHQTFTMSYEQLTSNPAETLFALQNFLNVVPRKLYSVLRKQS